MNVATDPRCMHCGSLAELGLAITAKGREYACTDGYACALRANGMKAALTVVHGPGGGGEATSTSGADSAAGPAEP